MSIARFNTRDTRDKYSKPSKGLTLIETLIVVTIVPIISVAVFRIFLFPFKTQAKAINFQEADLDASLFALKKSTEGSTDFSDVPADCTVKEEDVNLGVYSITCIRGNYDVKATAKANIYTQKINPFGGNYQDTSPQDGYEDFTGLPTHYDHCYSGQKRPEGQASAGKFNNAVCNLGELYVIPLFKNLY